MASEQMALFFLIIFVRMDGNVFVFGLVRRNRAGKVNMRLDLVELLGGMMVL